ncbi:MAG TPA: hypothetical protein VHJ58_08190, partial [Vicinamibacterales bacterium]|nr:hypothetical protein [Vicinamibacterales bacterium]
MCGTLDGGRHVACGDPSGAYEAANDVAAQATGWLYGNHEAWAMFGGPIANSRNHFQQIAGRRGGDHHNAVIVPAAAFDLTRYTGPQNRFWVPRSQVHNEPSAEFVAKHTCPELTDFIGIANRYGKGGGMLYV